MDTPTSDIVSRQYERWRYPAPIEDLEAWSRDRHELFDPQISARLLWPEGRARRDLDILIAGCGTNQAAVFAYRNPRAHVVGVDISEASLAHQHRLKTRHRLDNLELQQLPIESIAQLDRQFDLVVSTGVLHHMADPLAGLKALAGVVRRDGAVALMLYARYGRTGVEALQQVFRDLGMQQDDASLRIVRETMTIVPPDHPIQPYRRLAEDLDYDAGLVDTFLHGRDRSYTVEDCLRLVSDAGLEFQCWYNNDCYYPESCVPLASSLYGALCALPEPVLWATMERLLPRNACHYFVARPVAHKVDFDVAQFLSYVPALRWTVRRDGDTVLKGAMRVPLDRTQQLLLASTDGRRTVAEILVKTFGEAAATVTQPDLKTFALNFYRALWRLGVVAISISNREPIAI